MPGDERGLLTRRDMALGSATTILGLGAFRGRASLLKGSGAGKLEVGGMALDDYHRVSRKMWIGPVALRSEVPSKEGNVFWAVDDEVQYYHNGTEWKRLIEVEIRTPSVGFDNWRNPSEKRPIIVSATLTLNPGATTESRVDLNVDDSGGTSPNRAFPESVPASLDAAQFRSPPSVVIPPGGSYQFKEVSTGDGVAIEENTEQLI